ncbi:ABC transporter ATP-binding protein [Anaerorhabdus furcosa]|uniref:ABC-2 type transport system ATP-binding protein n=1 Tax=Anaerorhabdus furcosa TaxID=118967 RepID=A0A1T4P4B8_9FIRM|nr:ABC transporter ATP-binding protein [Anaerorhabdus furcosa]SJZ86241.1 ABC-2 type transport system ATP-binding protein [Anaerorhabdus furcosa]
MLVCENVRKEFTGFTLDNISINIPEGSIMGLIGENGAGKSTLISCILGSMIKTSGTVKIFNKNSETLTRLEKEDIGVVLSDFAFNGLLNCKDINTIMKAMYTKWDETYYMNFCNEHNLTMNKKIKDFSKGMQMKLSIIVALAHHPKLLILDEATSGLDPVARDELLDIFFDFVKEGDHSILISSHILSDLEKICDTITFISKGKVKFSETKDDLEYKYCIIKCDETVFSTIDKKDMIGVRKNPYGIEVCMLRKACPEGMKSDNASMEDIMVFASKGVNL